MRAASAVLAFVPVLAACSPVQEQATEGAETVHCALDNRGQLKPHCLLERDGPAAFTVRHPDGGFRRFGYDGNGLLQPADGADAIGFGQPGETHAEIIVAGDRYRLPSELVDVR